jgi:hypothetical protein
VREVITIVGKEGCFGKPPRNDRIGRAETRGQFSRQLRPIRILHDDRRKKVGPADEILVHGLEQSLDIGALESANVRRIVHISRRGANHHQAMKALWTFLHRQAADDAAHRVTHQDHIVKAQRIDDIDDILSVTVQAAIPISVVSRPIRLSIADVVEQHDAVLVFERGSNESPHVLVATKAVCEQDGLRSAPERCDVVPADYLIW